jgi:Rod binding domain-containing protein
MKAGGLGASAPKTDILLGEINPRKAKSPSKEEMEKVAKEFEGLFTSLVIKQMRDTLEPGVMFGDQGNDVYGGLFDMTMSQHLSQSGGLGISNMVKHQLEALKQNGSSNSKHPNGTTLR